MHISYKDYPYQDETPHEQISNEVKKQTNHPTILSPPLVILDRNSTLEAFACAPSRQRVNYKFSVLFMYGHHQNHYVAIAKFSGPSLVLIPIKTQSNC